jgi:2-oxoisovalerate dehydrogenase E1 component
MKHTTRRARANTLTLVSPRQKRNVFLQTPEEQAHFLEIYRAMYTAREIDRVEREYTGRGEAFFHVSGAGHEGLAVLSRFLQPDDYLHCHYRDKALLLARGITTEMFFHSLFCTAGSHSAGRQMSAHMSDPHLNVLSMVGPVGNHALQAAGIAAAIKDDSSAPLVVCSMGDGTSQQGEVLESIAEAVRWQLPLLFIIEDNRYSISTLTKQNTFYSRPDGDAQEFYGIPLLRVRGYNIRQCDRTFRQAVSRVRSQRTPTIVLFECERLSDHTNADDQRIYRDADEFDCALKQNDPLTWLKSALEENGIEAERFTELHGEVKEHVRAAAQKARSGSTPSVEFSAKRPLQNVKQEYRGGDTSGTLTMLDAIREVLRDRLRTDTRVVLYGEDIEDPKGDVFGLTRSLSTQFPGRVLNSPLSESTIVGTAIGRALAGQRPVAFLQFADFFPLAFNQIISELGSMYWRTNGGWECPVIVMITCGGYRPGLGPFHAQTMESLAAHVPGVDVLMPSTAGDAAGLLQAAFESGRPTLFFYPKSCLNDRLTTTSEDVNQQYVPLGYARVLRTGEDITLVGWGNTVSRCDEAAEILSSIGRSAEVIDLRSLQPWDKTTVINSVKKTRRLLVCQEDNLSCSMASEILATVTEEVSGAIHARRVTRADTFVPCNFENQLEILPSLQRLVTVAANMLNYDVFWEQPIKPPPGIEFITALGTSPSDESVTIQEWHVTPGQIIRHGDLIAVYEADKAAADLHSSIEGTVTKILVEIGQTVRVGSPLIEVKIPETTLILSKPVTKEDPGTPIFTRRATVRVEDAYEAVASRASVPIIGVIGISSSLGSREVSNSDLLSNHPAKTDDDIVRGTGISRRQWVKDGESAVSLAVTAAQRLFERTGTSLRDIDAILCSTGTPQEITPSLACQVLQAIGGDSAQCQAVDINAACSGYLYGLQWAYDYLSSCPKAQVLFITSEVLSPLLDESDFTTSIIFGDAATATLIGGTTSASRFIARLSRPLLSAQGDSGKNLRVPVEGPGQYITMSGSRVFSQGVKKMSEMLARVCAEAKVDLSDLDLIVPHQANQRIMDSIRNRFHLPSEKVFSNIETFGNTSSSSIPLCLEQILYDPARSEQRLGLAAFGGGFTFGACLLDRV